jgi:hypothetical protein
MKQRLDTSTIATCRAALRTGHLTKDGRNWIFGRRRRFRPRTVNALIDAGEAIRVGNHVVAWRAA